MAVGSNPTRPTTRDLCFPAFDGHAERPFRGACVQDACSARDQRRGSLRSFSLGVREQRRVDVRREADLRVPQQRLDHLQVPRRAVRERRGAVPEIVQTDRRQPGGARQAEEPRADERGVQRSAVLPGEHLARVHPGGAPRQAFLELPPTPRPEHRDGAGVERHDALAGVGLRVALVDLPADLH